MEMQTQKVRNRRNRIDYLIRAPSGQLQNLYGLSPPKKLLKQKFCLLWGMISPEKPYEFHCNGSCKYHQAILDSSFGKWISGKQRITGLAWIVNPHCHTTGTGRNMDGMSEFQGAIAWCLRTSSLDMSKTVTLRTFRYEDLSHFTISLSKVKYWSKQKGEVNL